MHVFDRNVPVYKSTLFVNEIELVVNSRQSLSNGSGAGNHLNSTLNPSRISSGCNCRRLVVDCLTQLSYSVMSTSLFIYRIHSARNILSSSLAEKGFQRIITSSKSLVRWHLSVGLDSVLKAVTLPAAITSLNTGLASVIRASYPGALLPGTTIYIDTNTGRHRQVEISLIIKEPCTIRSSILVLQ